MISYKNAVPLTRSEIVEYERKIYRKQQIRPDDIPEKPDIRAIQKRKIAVFKDKPFNMPQNIFILTTKHLPAVIGRKIISDLYLENKINAPNCSRITASMLLGFLVKAKRTEKDVSIQYRPFTNGEKLSFFREIGKDRLADLYFPFRYLDNTTGKEKQCSPAGWTISPGKAQNLANGEEHFRDYTKLYFKNIIKNGYVIYDPACSTGQFLASIKKTFPGCKTIGQDLSKEMTDYAQNQVDQIYTGDAINSPLPDQSVDVMFLRFLNSEIVTTRKAYRLFSALFKKVKTAGLIVLFGHTPVLLSKKYFSRYSGIKILHNNGYNKQHDSIFQYYVLEKN